MDDLVVLNQIQDVAVGTPSLIQGEWELIYSTAQAFRYSFTRLLYNHASVSLYLLINPFLVFKSVQDSKGYESINIVGKNVVNYVFW